MPVTVHESAYYLRFRVEDRPGIIAQLATALAAESISIDAVLQLPNANWRNLPFVKLTRLARLPSSNLPEIGLGRADRVVIGIGVASKGSCLKES